MKSASSRTMRAAVTRMDTPHRRRQLILVVVVIFVFILFRIGRFNQSRAICAAAWTFEMSGPPSKRKPQRRHESLRGQRISVRRLLSSMPLRASPASVFFVMTGFPVCPLGPSFKTIRPFHDPAQAPQGVPTHFWSKSGILATIWQRIKPPKRPIEAKNRLVEIA